MDALSIGIGRAGRSPAAMRRPGKPGCDHPSMQGLHLTADLSGCPTDAAAFTDADALRSLCVGAVRASGLQPVGELFHRFAEGGGVTGVVLLAESHVAVHTWPELAAVTIDVYVCNFSGDNTARAQTLLATLEAAFAPAAVQRHRLQRGRL
jgi:S-adenosylmethionine decarboxylase proenzyme